MKGLSTRVTANVVWLVLSGIGVIAAGFLSFASGILFDDSYEVSVPMPEAGGVLPEQEVTVLGRAVGQVEDVELTAEGVLLTLRIDGEHAVPSDADVRVLRRSPIGEQAVDLQPRTPDWTAAEPGATIVPGEAVVPAPVPFLLERTVELFEAIDVDDVDTVISELAVALEDRGPTLKQLGRDALDLNRTLVDGIPEFERSIASADAVLTTLQEHRRALADGFVNAADLTGILADEAPTVDRLLDTSTLAVNELDDLLRGQRANLSCLMSDVLSINDLLLGPSTLDGVNAGRYRSKLDEAEHALMRVPYFFHDGFHIIAQPDPLTGMVWTRILMVGPPEGGQAYPEKRPTPPTTPGAACTTVAWGTGVDAVRQDDPQPPDVTSPGIDYAPLVGAGDDDRAEPAPGGHDGVRAAPRPDLPATGGGPPLLASLTIGAAVWLRRRR